MNTFPIFMEVVLNSAAYVLEATSLLLLVLVLIFMAKGLTITRGRISMGGSVKISIFMTLYTIIYAALFIWEALVRNQLENL